MCIRDRSPAPTTAAPTVTAAPTIDGLALVIDGSKDTFYYDSPLWTNDQLYNRAGELKARAFFEPKHEFTVVMEYGSEERSLTIELDEAKSLQDLFAGGYTATDASVDAWRALVPDAGYQNNCNRQGFNTESDGCHVGMSHCRLRLGIWFNNEGDCHSSDSFVGIGAAEFSSGSKCHYNGDGGGTCDTKATVTRIYARAAPSPAPTATLKPSLSPAPTINAVCAAGYYSCASCCDQDADCSCNGHGGDAYDHAWRTPKCPEGYYECGDCCDRDADCACDDQCERFRAPSCFRRERYKNNNKQYRPCNSDLPANVDCSLAYHELSLIHI